MTDTLPIDLGQLSDVGRSRSVNEDYIETVTDEAHIAQGGRLFLLADGVGGEAYGEVASRTATRAAAETYYKYLASHPEAQPGTALHAALLEANRQVFAEANARQAAGHMATTMVVAALQANQMTIGWVGDSRAYIIRHKSASPQQITYDHSQVEEQVRLGVLTPEQAASHPRRNVLSRSIGGQETVDVDVVLGTVTPGDMVVICSDGLTNHVDDEEIGHYAREGGDSQVVAERLVEMANERGGKDNISVIVIYVGERGVQYEPADTVNFYGLHDTHPEGINEGNDETMETDPILESNTQPAPPTLIQRRTYILLLGLVALLLVTFVVLAAVLITQM